MTMSENEVVMALSQKVAQLERRIETLAKLHLGLSEKYELLARRQIQETRAAIEGSYHDA